MPQVVLLSMTEKQTPWMLHSSSSLLSTCSTCTCALLQVVVNQILLGLIAALGCLVGGTLLLPSLATDELREVLADIIQKCGYSISGYASRIFPPEQVSSFFTLCLTTIWNPEQTCCLHILMHACLSHNRPHLLCNSAASSGFILQTQA